MKRCLACHHAYDMKLDTCPHCQHQTEKKNGIPCFAPELAHEGGGFKADYFNELARLEAENFWFRARNDLILWMIQQYCADFSNYLEIGCGTGFVLSGIADRYPDRHYTGSEVFLSGLQFAVDRLPAANFIQMDARKIPFEKEFDLIGAFDVIEHIAEDSTVLAQLYNTLTPGGHVLITVPQHDWLWSATDEYACHERRYSAQALHQKVTDSGFTIIKSTSFVSVLLPLMLLSRIKQKDINNDEFDPTAELRLSPVLNQILYRLMQAERQVIKTGINLPIGGSRLLIAQKARD